MLLLCCYLCELVSEILHTTHFWLGLHYTMFILLKYQIPRGHVTNLHFYVFGELFSQQAMKSSKFNSGQHTGDLKLEKTTHLHNSCDIDTCTAVFKMVLSKEGRKESRPSKKGPLPPPFPPPFFSRFARMSLKNTDQLLTYSIQKTTTKNC